MKIHTTLRLIYSPDDGGWYAERVICTSNDDGSTEFRTRLSRDIYPSRERLQRCVTRLKWDPEEISILPAEAIADQQGQLEEEGAPR